MEVPSQPSPQQSQSRAAFFSSSTEPTTNQYRDDASAVGSTTDRSVEIPPPPPPPISPKTTTSMPVNGNYEQKLLKNNKKRKKAALNASVQPSSSISSASSCSPQRAVRVLNIRRRSPRILLGSNRRGESDVDAIALPLGMSVAAVLSQVLERNDAVGEQLSVDHLSMICTLAVRESLSNVFGNKFEGFVRNFEKSFSSTLGTLKVINDTSIEKEKCCSSRSSMESNTSGVIPLMPSLDKVDSMSHGVQNCHSEAKLSAVGTWGQLITPAEEQENVQISSANGELALHGQRNQQLACVTPGRPGSVNHSMLSTFERSVEEQARANDLKTFEISLQMKSLRLKETKLDLDSDSNLLERFKISMGISKASFKAEKFKNQVEDTRHAELLKKCIDCLVAGLFIMSMSLGYGAYVHSYKRIVEATASCAPPKESKSWWIPKSMTSLNSGLQTLGCQVQVLSRMLFGVLMILVIAYSLLQRSGSSRQGMPITFILLILGVACGFAGKFCVDTLGGNGYHWLIYWEALCLLHFFSNVCTSILFVILHGPVTAKNNSAFPYWIRRLLFYTIVLLFLPILCGLMPFATPSEWKDHVMVLVMDLLGTDEIEIGA